MRARAIVILTKFHLQCHASSDEEVGRQNGLQQRARRSMTPPVAPACPEPVGGVMQGGGGTWGHSGHAAHVAAGGAAGQGRRPMRVAAHVCRGGVLPESLGRDHRGGSSRREGGRQRCLAARCGRETRRCGREGRDQGCGSAARRRSAGQVREVVRRRRTDAGGSYGGNVQISHRHFVSALCAHPCRIAVGSTSPSMHIT